MGYKKGDKVKIIKEELAYKMCARSICNGDIAEVALPRPAESKNDLRCVSSSKSWEYYFGIPYEAIELVKEDTMDTGVKSVYKVVRIEDGKYLSVFCGCDIMRGWSNRQLEYTIGQVTEALPAREGGGIYCFGSLEGAKKPYLDHTYDKGTEPWAVLECYPIGGIALRHSHSDECFCPAVYVKAEVWKEEEVSPFKVGDYVKIKDDWVGKHNKFGGEYMAYSGVVKCVDEDSVGLKDYHWTMNEPEAIELTWVDVTRECTVRIVGHHVEISHGGTYVLGLGGAYAALTVDPVYKVEVDKDSGCAGKFKVLKLVKS